jgi:hypothetical protein
MSDGFDWPMGGMKAGGVEATVRLLSQVADLLTRSMRLLGSEFGTGKSRA